MGRRLLVFTDWWCGNPNYIKHLRAILPFLCKIQANINLEKIPKEKWDAEYNILLENFTSEDRQALQKVLEKDDITEDDVLELDKQVSQIKLGSVAQEMKRLGIIDKKSKDMWCFENAWRICQCASSASVLELAVEKRLSNANPVFFVKSKKGMIYMARNQISEDAKKPRIQLIFADDNLMLHPGDFWADIKTTGLDGEGTVAFKNSKKPELLIKRILSMNTQKGDLILDSFLGSGTTVAVAHKMGLRYIGIEMGEHAQTHCIPRLQKVIDGEQGGISKAVDWQGGGGFSFYSLGEPVFDAEGHIANDVRFADLAAYIWWLETKTPTGVNRDAVSSPFIGKFNGVAYYLLYNGILGDRRPNGGNVLTSGVLAHLLEVYPHSGKKIVFGEASRLGFARLTTENIEFKQIPYELHDRV
jgi:adenine-specific DNA-methyltransferase